MPAGGTAWAVLLLFGGGIGVVVLQFLWRAARLIVRLVRLILALLIFVLLVQRSTLPTGLQFNAIAILSRDYHFDFIDWEFGALKTKVGQALWGVHPFLSEAQRVQFVRDYMALVAQAQHAEAQVNAIYTDPNIRDPEGASTELRAERDYLRADLRERQPLAESILEGQVAAVLTGQEFGLGGQLLPPLAFHFTQTPNVLVVSPRDAIRFDVAINLDGMTVEEIAALESRIDSERDVASLIVPLGGIAVYPAMVLETASIPAALETIAHEWVHHYLFTYPLGYQFSFAGETRIINETTANLFGREVGRLVLARYYPDLAPPPSLPAESPPIAFEIEPPAFDFGREMHETRVTVDELLAEGRVAEAEAFMEARRGLFVENGHAIRKLNQAYFAFFGGYQSGQPGAGGDDPIGVAIQDMRDLSPSLHDWVVALRGVTTRDELLAARDALAARGEPPRD